MKTIIARLERLIQDEPTSGCWLWTGANSHGYGLISIKGKTKPVHRVAYEAFVGPIPDGLHIDHKCKVRSCVNPAHLEAVTVKENVARSISSNREKAACWRGHPFTPENTYQRTDRPGRHCRACHNERQRLRGRGGVSITRPLNQPTPRQPRPSVEDRFRSQCRIDESGCWLWTGYINTRWGYGNFSLGGRSQQAHRVSHELFLGPIPPGMVVHHRCAVRACVNPEHLEAMPQRANLMEAPTSHASRNAAKVICIRGHRGTFVRDRSGHRHCKVCNRLRQRAYRARPPQEG